MSLSPVQRACHLSHWLAATQCHPLTLTPCAQAAEGSDGGNVEAVADGGRTDANTTEPPWACAGGTENAEGSWLPSVDDLFDSDEVCPRPYCTHPCTVCVRASVPVFASVVVPVSASSKPFHPPRARHSV